MITGIGNDLIEIERLKKMEAKYGQRFLRRILTPAEMEYAESRKKNRHHSIAGRFAAKEALMKVLGTGLGNGVGFLDFEILPDDAGRPNVVISNRLKQRFSSLRLHISITHTDTIASAVAIAEKNEA